MEPRIQGQAAAAEWRQILSPYQRAAQRELRLLELADRARFWIGAAWVIGLLACLILGIYNRGGVAFASTGALFLIWLVLEFALRSPSDRPARVALVEAVLTGFDEDELVELRLELRRPRLTEVPESDREEKQDLWLELKAGARTLRGVVKQFREKEFVTHEPAHQSTRLDTRLETPYVLGVTRRLSRLYLDGVSGLDPATLEAFCENTFESATGGLEVVLPRSGWKQSDARALGEAIAASLKGNTSPGA